MTETHVDKYSLDCKVKRFSLKVCIFNDQQILLELTNKNGPEKYRTILSLEQLKDLSFAFYSAESIYNALLIIKNTVESGKIAVEEKANESKVELELNIYIDSVEYPPFIINLLSVQNNGNYENANIQESPPIFNYNGNKELEAKYGNIDHDTTEVNSIIESKTNPDAMELEYIQPIVQYHYPDGSTRSTPLTPKLKMAGGTNPNMSEEEINNIKEMIIKDNKKRSLSPVRESSTNPALAKEGYYQTRTMPHLTSYKFGMKQFNDSDSVLGEGEEVNAQNVEINGNPETFLGDNEYNFETPLQTLEVNNLNATANPYQTSSYSPLIQNMPINNLGPSASIPFVFMQPNIRPSMVYSTATIPVLSNSFITPTQIPLQSNIIQPMGSMIQPMGSIIQPMGNTIQPIGSMIQPLGSMIQPMGSVIQPTNSIIQPMGNIIQPANSIIQPMNNLIQQNQFLPQSQVDLMGNEYFMGSYSPGANPYFPYSLTYPKKYYFPKFKK